MPDRAKGGFVPKDQERVVVEGEVAERQAAAPGFGEGRFGQHQDRQRDGDQADEQAVSQKHKAACPKLDRAALATLAGLGNKAFAGAASGAGWRPSAR